jgi:hypothetical protein
MSTDDSIKEPSIVGGAAGFTRELPRARQLSGDDSFIAILFCMRRLAAPPFFFFFGLFFGPFASFFDEQKNEVTTRACYYEKSFGSLDFTSSFKH